MVRRMHASDYALCCVRVCVLYLCAYIAGCVSNLRAFVGSHLGQAAISSRQSMVRKANGECMRAIMRLLCACECVL